MNITKHIVQRILILFTCLCSKTLFAQEPISKMFSDTSYNSRRICSNDVLLLELRKDKNFAAKENKMNEQIIRFGRPASGDTLLLPVVVHIINQNPFGISDAFVINGINDLNDAYGKSGAYSSSPGADTKIRFCIAKKDPDGGITSGITRTTSYFGDHLNMDNEDAKLKNLVQWDPKRYINIWLITSINAESYANFSCGVWTRLGVSGYATMPPGGSALDGVVVTSFGVLLAHEMGHYLGLYHTFQGGCYNYNCATDGDMVCDTPPDGSMQPSPNCNSPYNSCSTDTLSNYSNGFFKVDVPDQIDNFMDYGNTACSRRFTQGQADRMKAAILTQRPGLLQDECSPPCADLIKAEFLRDTAYTSIGETVNFTNTSTGAANFTWLIDDVAISSQANFTHTFNATGKFKITLKAFNADAACFAAYTSYVMVGCGVTARFYTNKKAIACTLPLYPDSIIFTNNSFRGQTCQWLMGNDKGMAEQVVSTAINLTYIFPVYGNYTVRLVATNGGCSDTTSFYYINVQDATPDGVVVPYAAFCYQQTKVILNLCIDNYGYAPLPKGTPVTFYDADPRLPGAKKLSPTFYLPYETVGGNCRYCFYNHILDIGYANLNQVYAVFNDSGNTTTLSLPNTLLPEKNYVNNTSLVNNIRFRVTVTPPAATLLPSDTLQLQAQAYPNGSTYLWSDPYKLSCTTCSNPKLYADSDRVKRVIATSGYGCKDTTYVTIKVPPADDFTIKINSVLCASKDSMTVNFTVLNGFFRGLIPKGLAISFFNGNPAAAGAVLLAPVYKVQATVAALQASFITRIKIMPQGTLYAVVNDALAVVPVSLPNNPLLLEKLYTNNTTSIEYIPNKTSFDISICQGSSYYGYNAAGIYTDTLAGYNGCDSIRTVRLTVRPVFATTVTTAICQGENYAGYTASGKYVDIYIAANGCDSTRTLNLTVKPTFKTRVDTSICQGQNYAGHTVTGTYTDVYAASNGCDSTRTLSLIVKPTFATIITTTICQGENYAGHTVTGNYVDVYTAVNGCDSTRTLNLTVKPAFKTNITTAICQGENYAGYTTSGIFTDTYTAINGCDSTRTLNLTVNPLLFSTVTIVICQGENYAGHTNTGIYNDVYRSRYGCDSTRTLNLTVKPLSFSTVTAVICEKENYAGHTVSGTYTDVYPAANGCDSTRTLKLTVNPVKGLTVNADICEGQSYFAGGRLQTKTGVYIDTAKTHLGCDSIKTTNLTVHANPRPNLGEDRGICSNATLTLTPGSYASYTWQDGATSPTYTTALLGKYYVQVKDIFGCKGADTILLNQVLPLPANFLPPDSNLCKGNILQVSVPGYKTYLWSSGSSNSFISIDNTGTYKLQVTDRFDCSGADSLNVLFYTDCIIIGIPSAFTPNGDGINETFKPLIPAPVTNYRMLIYNRTGQLLFETQNPAKGWDGTYKGNPQDPAAYVYFITLRDYLGRVERRKGSLVLIR